MTKNVCMIVYTNYPLDARVRREAETLAKDSGFEVLALTLKENSIPKTYRMDGVVVKELNIEKYRGKSGFRYIYSYLKFVWLSLLECMRLFLRGQIDIIHVHNMPNFLVFSAILPWIFGKKVILDIHDSVPETFLSKFHNHSGVFFKILCLEERISCAFAHKIICVNHVQRNILVKRGISEEKISISMNVPDHTRFQLSPEKKAERGNENNFRMVYHGTVAERLGIDLAILAVSRLVNDIPDLEFNIWGEGDFLNKCIEVNKGLSIENNIKFRGIIPLHAIVDAFKEIDLGIVANRRDAATELMLPVKMLEYIALSIPVVVPRLKCIEYYFSDKMVCYFEPENVDSMASAILKLYKDKSLRKSQAERAKAFLDKYGWEKHQKDLINLYREL